MEIWSSNNVGVTRSWARTHDSSILTGCYQELVAFIGDAK